HGAEQMLALRGVVFADFECKQLERGVLGVKSRNARGDAVERRARHEPDVGLSAAHLTGGGLRPIAFRITPPALSSPRSASAREEPLNCITIAVFTSPPARVSRSRASARSRPH